MIPKWYFSSYLKGILSKQWVIDRINISVPAFRIVTMPCYYVCSSLDQFWHVAGWYLNYICIVFLIFCFLFKICMPSTRKCLLKRFYALKRKKIELTASSVKRYAEVSPKSSSWIFFLWIRVINLSLPAHTCNRRLAYLIAHLFASYTNQ